MACGIFPTCNWVVFHPRITHPQGFVDCPRILVSKTVIQVSWVVCFNLPWITIRKELQYGNSAILFWRIGCQTIQGLRDLLIPHLEVMKNHFNPPRESRKNARCFFFGIRPWSAELFPDSVLYKVFYPEQMGGSVFSKWVFFAGIKAKRQHIWSYLGWGGHIFSRLWKRRTGLFKHQLETNGQNRPPWSFGRCQNTMGLGTFSFGTSGRACFIACPAVELGRWYANISFCESRLFPEKYLINQITLYSKWR